MTTMCHCMIVSNNQPTINEYQRVVGLGGLCSKIVLICYAAIPSMKLYHAQVKFYYADTMLTRANHATYHVTNVASSQAQ